MTVLQFDSYQCMFCFYIEQRWSLLNPLQGIQRESQSPFFWLLLWRWKNFASLMMSFWMSHGDRIWGHFVWHICWRWKLIYDCINLNFHLKILELDPKHAIEQSFKCHAKQSSITVNAVLNTNGWLDSCGTSECVLFQYNISIITTRFINRCEL